MLISSAISQNGYRCCQRTEISSLTFRIVQLNLLCLPRDIGAETTSRAKMAETWPPRVPPRPIKDKPMPLAARRLLASCSRAARSSACDLHLYRRTCASFSCSGPEASCRAAARRAAVRRTAALQLRHTSRSRPSLCKNMRKRKLHT